MLLFTEKQYAMKRNYLSDNQNPIEIKSILDAPSEKNLQNTAGSFECVPIDILRIIFIFTIKEKAHLKSSISNFCNMNILNKWFYNIISQEEEHVYTNAMPPIVFAAFTGNIIRFAFEKVFNKEQLYPKFLDGFYENKYIPSDCVMHDNIKKFLMVSANIGKNINAEDQKAVEHYYTDDTGIPHFRITLNEEMSTLLDNLTQKINHLSEEEYSILVNAYDKETLTNPHDLTKKDKSTLLYCLLKNFIYTMHLEDNLHELLDTSCAIPLKFFTILEQNNGNLLSYDADRKTFLEKSLDRTDYFNITNTLISFYQSKNLWPIEMISSASYKLLFPNGKVVA